MHALPGPSAIVRPGQREDLGDHLSVCPCAELARPCLPHPLANICQDGSVQLQLSSSFADILTFAAVPVELRVGVAVSSKVLVRPPASAASGTMNRRTLSDECRLQPG